MLTALWCLRVNSPQMWGLKYETKKQKNKKTKQKTEFPHWATSSWSFEIHKNLNHFCYRMMPLGEIRCLLLFGV